MKARDIMTTKLVTVGPETSVKDVVALLVEHKVSGIPVVDAEGKVLGMVSEGDVLRKKIAPKTPDVLSILGAMVYYDGAKEYQEAFRKMAANTAQEIMTEPVIAVDVDDDFGKVGQVILDHHIKRVPVLDKEKLVGLISRSDLVKLMLA
jgi:CBS domain-containing protein